MIAFQYIVLVYAKCINPPKVSFLLSHFTSNDTQGKKKILSNDEGTIIDGDRGCRSFRTPGV
jgi:hypothetical protein